MKRWMAIFVFTIVGLSLAQVALAVFERGWIPSGDGNYNQFSIPSGTDHYVFVNDAHGTNCDSGTANFTTTVGDRDSYVSTSTSPGTITAIKVEGCIGTYSLFGTTNANFFWDLGSYSGTDSGNFSPTSIGHTYFSHTWTGLNIPNDPSLGNIDFGAIYSSGDAGLRLYNISVVITYQ